MCAGEPEGGPLRGGHEIDRQVVAVAGHTGDADTALSALHAEDPELRRLALGALDRMGRLDDVTVRAALNDTAPVVRRRAVTIAATRPTVRLRDALSDPDVSVVEVACWAVGEQPDPDLVPDLARLASSHGDALVREAAVAALGAIGDVRGLPAILTACRDLPAVRRRAVLALAPFEGPDVDEALQSALGDRDWQVRQAAEDVLPRPHGG